MSGQLGDVSDNIAPGSGAVQGTPLSVGTILRSAREQGAEYFSSMVACKGRIREHVFGRPFQLGHHAASDAPADGVVQEYWAQPGNVIVVGTDGVFDNLHDYEIARVVDQTEQHWRAAVPLLTAAFDASQDTERETPWSSVAHEELDMYYIGGKPDDMTVVVMTLYDRAEQERLKKRSKAKK